MSDQLSYANLAVALAFSNLLNVSFWLKGRCQEREKISKFPDFVFRQTTDKIQPFSKSFLINFPIAKFKNFPINFATFPKCRVNLHEIVTTVGVSLLIILHQIV